MRRAGLPRWELQSVERAPPVEPMLAADRTGSKIRPRQGKTVPLKSFACNYRMGADFAGCGLVVASELDNVITGTSLSPGRRDDRRRKWGNASSLLAWVPVT
jgi:hypothetical protein